MGITSLRSRATIADEYNIFRGKSWQEIALSTVLLDPKAWQAVYGAEKTVKVSHGNWDDMKTMTEEHVPLYKWQMHQMIDALAEGRTIDEFLETLKDCVKSKYL